MEEEGVCKLCNKKRILVKGHIYPNFFTKWIRKENKDIKSFYYRHLKNGEWQVEKRQNTLTFFLFCNECDNEILSKIEGSFKKNCFKQILNGEFNFVNEYSLLIQKFSASIAFRVLYHMEIFDPKNFHEVGPELLFHATQATKEWCSIITQDINSYCYYNLYFDYLFTNNNQSSSSQWNLKHMLFQVDGKLFLAVLCGPLIILGSLNPKLNFTKDMVSNAVDKLLKTESENNKRFGPTGIIIGSNPIFNNIRINY